MTISSQKPLISVLNEDGNICTNEVLCNNSNNNNDDELPPPLFIGSNVSCLNDDIQLAMSHEQDCKIERPLVNTGPSLMEQMMKEASDAKGIEDGMLREKQRKESQSAFRNNSGDGFKKGFLNSSKNSKKSKVSSESCTKSSVSKSMTSVSGDNVDDGIIDIRHLKASNRNEYSNFMSNVRNDLMQHSSDGEPDVFSKPIMSLSDKMESLRLDSVQNALQSDPLSALAQGDWATTELMEKVNKNPKLQRFINDERYVRLLESLKKDPKKTLMSLQNQPEVLATLNEFCQLMGDHFTRLGEDKNEERRRKLGPLEKEALEKHKKRSGKIGWEESVSKEEQDRVEAILADRDISSILMDPDMQMIIKECGEMPGKMHYFMKSEEYGPKLKKLIHAGLLKIER